MTAPPRPVTYTTRVNAFVETSKRLLRELGRADLERDISDSLTTSSCPSAVYVFGERGTGKSSLINSLLLRPNASPTADVADSTSAFLRFRYRDNKSIASDSSESVIPELGIADLRERAMGNPNNLHSTTIYDIRLESPILRAVTLVDTPGIGGLDQGYGRLAVQALSAGSAMIFVTEAGAPLSRPEIEFLCTARQRVEEIIVVVTKIDAYRGWRTVARDNARILEEVEALASTPIIGVSNTTAHRALMPENRADTKAYLAESGIARLGQVIVTHVGGARVEGLRLAKSVLICSANLKIARQSLEEQKLATRQDPKTVDALLTAQRQLKEMGRERSRWLSQLDHDVRRISMDRNESLRRGLLELQQRYTQRAITAKRRHVEGLPAQLMAEIEALTWSLIEQSNEQLITLARALLGQLDEQSNLSKLIQEAATATLSEGTDISGSAGQRTGGISERLALVSSFSSGRGLLSNSFSIASQSVAIAPFIGLAAPLGVGVIFAALSSIGRRSAAMQQEMRSWIREQLSAAQGDLSNSFARQIHEIQGELRTMLTDCLQRRQDELDELIDRSRSALDVEKSEGQRTSATLTGNMRLISSQISKADELLALLRANRESDRKN